MAKSKLNWVENRISGKVLQVGSAETSWKHYAAYSKSHSSSWTKKSTESITNGNASDHSKTSIETTTYIAWKNKSETIGGKKAQQYYKLKTSDTVLTGFMSSVDSKYFANLSDKYSRVYLCRGAVCEDELRDNINVENIIPQPNTFNVDYVDFDVVKSGSGSNVMYTNGVNRSETSGYLVRDRKRANLRNLTISWSMVREEDAKRILYGLTRTEWIKVNFLDPLSCDNITRMFAITGKSIEGANNDTYRNLVITMEEV